MERSLYFSALALGVVAWVCSLLLAPRRAKNPVQKMSEWLPTPYCLVAGIVPVVGFLASCQTRPPFAAGQGLGFGLLLGSVGAMLTLWGIARSWQEDAVADTAESRNAVNAVTPFAIAIVVVAVPLIWMRNVVVDALFGVAMGWLASTLLLLAGINAVRIERRTAGLILAAGTGFVAALCAVGAVGELGGNVRVGSALTGVPWSAPLLLLSAFMVFTLLLCALPSTLLRHLPGASLLLRASSSLTRESTRQSAPHIARWLVGGLLFVAVGTQFGHRLWGQPNLFRLIGIGVAASGLAWWMIAGQARTAENGSNGWQRMALPTLVMMAAGMVAFQMLSGVGVAIMLLGAWLTMGIALVSAQESRLKSATTSLPATSALTVPSELLRLLLFGTLLLLYRLFQVRYHDDLQNVLLPDHYALLGFIVGAAVPAAIAQWLVVRDQGAGEENTGQGVTLIPLLRMLIAGVLLLFVPALLLMLFGTKCLLCLFFGLALAMVIGNGSRQDEWSANADTNTFRSMPSEWLIGLFALGIGLAVAQWTAHVLPVTLMARADKARLLTYLTGIVALLLFVIGVFGRTRRSTEITQKGGGK